MSNDTNKLHGAEYPTILNRTTGKNDAIFTYPVQEKQAEEAPVTEGKLLVDEKPEVTVDSSCGNECPCDSQSSADSAPTADATSDSTSTQTVSCGGELCSVRILQTNVKKLYSDKLITEEVRDTLLEELDKLVSPENEERRKEFLSWVKPDVSKKDKQVKAKKVHKKK